MAENNQYTLERRVRKLRKGCLRGKRNEIDRFTEMSEHTEKRLSFLTVFEEHECVMSAQKTKQLNIEII